LPIPDDWLSIVLVCTNLLRLVSVQVRPLVSEAS
jgi:hypothetical protein